MIEWTVTGGLAIVAIIQGASYFRAGKMLDKMDNLVTEDRCEERRENCSAKKSMKYIQHQVGHHEHNGNGVKFLAKD